MDEVRLKEYMKTLKGYAFKSEFYKDNGTPIIRVSDFTENSISDENLEYIDSDLFDNYKKFCLKEKDILIQTVGSWQNNPASVVGKVVNVPSKLNNSLLNQNAVKIIPMNIEQNFLYYLLKSDYFKYYILSTAQGAANQASITLESIGKFKFMLPSSKEQKRIGTILSSYDNLIENNNKRIKLLENMAEELYKEWFVRLRFPNYENTKIVDGVPNGWKKEKIENVCNVGRGSSPRPITDTRYFENGNIPWLKIADATASFIYIYKTKEYVNDYGASFSRKLPEDSLIIAASGTLGFPMFLATECCIHDGWMYFIDLEKDMKIYFYYALIYLKEYFNNQSYGAAIQNINTGIVKNSSILIPEKKIFEEFNKIVISIFDEIKILQKKNQNLKQTRDLLLPRLISGKLDIEDLEIV